MLVVAVEEPRVEETLLAVTAAEETVEHLEALLVLIT